MQTCSASWCGCGQGQQGGVQQGGEGLQVPHAQAAIPAHRHHLPRPITAQAHRRRTQLQGREHSPASGSVHLHPPGAWLGCMNRHNSWLANTVCSCAQELICPTGFAAVLIPQQGTIALAAAMKLMRTLCSNFRQLATKKELMLLFFLARQNLGVRLEILHVQH